MADEVIQLLDGRVVPRVKKQTPAELTASLQERSIRISGSIANRQFRVRRYYDGLGGVLLLRSEKGGEHALNVDLVFWRVAYCAIRTNLSSFTLRLGTEQEREVFVRGMGRPFLYGRERLFILQGSGWSDHIIALKFSITENSDEPWEIPSSPTFVEQE